jgi:hypothetical protein
VQFGFNRLTRLLLAAALTLLWSDGAVALDRKLVHPLAQERELWVDHQIRRGPGEALPRHYQAVAKSELGVEETVDARSLNNLAMLRPLRRGRAALSAQPENARRDARI